MDTFLIKAVQLIVALAFLVIIHEFGHFLFARIFGVKVEKFYIFFDPWTELFKWRPKKYIGAFGKTKKLRSCPEGEPDGDEKPKGFWSDTEYGIGWLPLGGYCKIAGMIDESMDTEQMKQPAKPWEFRSKPAWQRLLIMIAGVLFNFLLAIIIYAGIVFATGEKYVPFREAKLGMAYSGAAHDIGFRDGDIPLYADGEELSYPPDARMKMAQAKVVTVEREGRRVDVAVPSDFLLRLDREAKSDTAMISFFTYRIPTRVINVVKGEGAYKAGIREGDEIIALNDTATPSLDVFFRHLAGHNNQTVALTVTRAAAIGRDTLRLDVPLSDNSKMGVALEVDPSKRGEELQPPSVCAPRHPDGRRQAHLLRLVDEARLHQGGSQQPRRLRHSRQHIPRQVELDRLLEHRGLLLGGTRLHEHPADSDGGHVLFLLYEVIFRRAPSQKFMERAQVAGMLLLIALLIYANGMDIYRFFVK